MAAIRAAHARSRHEMVLDAILVLAFGTNERARALLGQALAQSALPALPAEPRDLIRFVKAHVLPIVTAELGAPIAFALLDDLARELGVELEEGFAAETSSHPRSIARSIKPMRPRKRSSVLLVDANRLTRGPLARALVRGGNDLRVCETLEEVMAELACDAVDLVILDLDHTQAPEIVEALLDSSSSMPIVARAAAPGNGTAFLRAAGAEAFDVRASAASPEEIVDVVRRVLER